MSDPILTWEKTMTSRQAAKYLLTGGFVAVELYREMERQIAALKEAAESLREYLTESDGIELSVDIPDEVWLPFIAALKEGEMKCKDISPEN